MKKEGVRTATKKLSVAYILGDTRRLGLVVAGSVGNAVERNRIKRVVREHFRINKERYPNGDIVVVAKHETADLTNDELRANIEEIIERIRKRG